MSFRRLKKQIESLLGNENLATGLARLKELPPRQSINPLFSLLHSSLPRIRWRSVTAIGIVIAELAENDFESARVYMRRLMWHLNEESGGIGWGSPEAMGEIMARHQQLSEEYASILISYITPSGNYLEYEPLQQGVLWGIGRLGYSHPDRVSAAAPCLLPFLSSQNVNLRGLAAWASGPMMDPQLWTVMEQLRNDRESFTFYWDDRFLTREVSEVAEAALNWVLTKKNRISQ